MKNRNGRSECMPSGHVRVSLSIDSLHEGSRTRWLEAATHAERRTSAARRTESSTTLNVCDHEAPILTGGGAWVKDSSRPFGRDVDTSSSNPDTTASCGWIWRRSVCIPRTSGRSRRNSRRHVITFSGKNNVSLEALLELPYNLWTPAECPLCRSGIALDALGL